MATYTSKFNLTKQAGGENQSLPILNQNLDKIDQELNKSRPLPLSKSSVSSLPTTITDSRITATMICPPGGMRLSNQRPGRGLDHQHGGRERDHQRDDPRKHDHLPVAGRTDDVRKEQDMKRLIYKAFAVFAGGIIQKGGRHR